MPVRPVLQLGDPLLRERSSPVDDPRSPHIRSLVRDLEDTLAHWRKAATDAALRLLKSASCSGSSFSSYPESNPGR